MYGGLIKYAVVCLINLLIRELLNNIGETERRFKYVSMTCLSIGKI